MIYDFEKAEKQYPKSIDNLFQWLKDKHQFQRAFIDLDGNLCGDGDGTLFFIDPLNLQFFFDSAGIIGEVLYDNLATNSQFEPNIYFGKWILADKGFPTRELALAECWNKCFEILEKSL